MYTQKASLIFVFLLLSFSLQSASAELKLPAKAKQVKTTTADKLGSRENMLGLKTGEHVPEFETHTWDGESITLGKLLENAPLMVIFYRGGWCPFCNYQVRQLTRAYAKFKQRNVTPVLVSVDKTEGAALLQQSYEIPFPVLSDPELAAHNAFNTVIHVDDTQYEKYQKFGIELEAWSGTRHHKIAAPGIFLVSKDGRVLWSHVAIDFKTRPDVEQLLRVIDSTLN